MPGAKVSVAFIHVAAATKLATKSVEFAALRIGGGIAGDRYEHSRRRPVTMQSLTELAAAAVDLGCPIDPSKTRRNITLSAGEMPTTIGTRISLGSLVLEVVRPTPPCRLLDDEIGPGAMTALRGRAGIACNVIEGGTLTVGDPATW